MDLSSCPHALLGSSDPVFISLPPCVFLVLALAGEASTSLGKSHGSDSQGSGEPLAA